MQKIQTKNWKIALDYFIPSLVIGLVISVLWGLWQTICGASMESNVFGMVIAASFGAYFGSRRINRKYSIASSKKIAEFAGYYYAIAVIVIGLAIEMIAVKISVLDLVYLSSAANSVGYFLVATIIYEAEALFWIKSDSELLAK